MPTALISVYDKSGIAELASTLQSRGWSIVSSGGTATALANAGVKVTDVADITGSGAILGHRVVTLHPRIHAAILADLSEPSHRDDLARLGVDPISLVVVNLYPFAESPSVELIDVGGPAMVRGAAKNHAHVGVVVRPGDYARVAAEIEAQGSLSDATRRDLARIAFSVTPTTTVRSPSGSHPTTSHCRRPSPSWPTRRKVSATERTRISKEPGIGSVVDVVGGTRPVSGVARNSVI